MPAARIYHLLQDQVVPGINDADQDDGPPRLDVYFDQAAPGVEAKAESAAAAEIVACKAAEASRQLAQIRVIESQAARAKSEAQFLDILQMFDKYEAYKPTMEEWETDFHSRADALRARAKDALPNCNQVGGFTVYERQMVGVHLDNLPENELMFACLAVVPGSSPGPGDWAPAVLDVFFGEGEGFSPGRDRSRIAVKNMMGSLPSNNQWSLLIGLGTPHLLTYHDRNYRVSRTNISMNDDGDMIMAFDICLEAKQKVNQDNTE